MKKDHPVSFRFSQEAIDALAWLVEHTELKRGQVIERALLEMQQRAQEEDLRGRVARLEGEMLDLRKRLESPTTPTDA